VSKFSAFRSLAWLGLAWLGLAWLGLAFLGFASLGFAWLGFAWLGLKNKQYSTLFARYFETLVSRIGSKRILRRTKYGKFAHM